MRIPIKLKYTLSIILLLLCLPFAIHATEPKSGGILIWGRGGDSVGLDPSHEDDGESFKVCDNIYECLVTYKQESTEIIPCLAESWTISEDGLNYTFLLRKEVKFHDGTPFDANAVLFSFNRQRLEDHPFAKTGGPYKYWANMGMSQIISDIVKLNSHEIKLVLTKPEAPFLANLGMNFCAIVSPTAACKWKDDFNFHPVGTGPFKFDRWDKDDKIVLVANEEYWNGRPYLDKLIFRSIPDNATRLLELQTGSIHGMDFPNPEDLKIIEKDPNLKLLKQTGMNVCYLGMNMDHKPFDNLKVRQAVNHSINKTIIVEALYSGLGQVALNPIPPILWGYHSTIPQYEYNPEKARELLKEAGFEDGFETTLYVMDVPRPYLPNPRKVSQAIQADLAEVGIKAKIVTYEWGTFLDKTDNGEHDMVILGWSGDNGDPDNFLYLLLDKDAAKIPATNLAFYRSDELHKLLISAKRATKQEEREKLYRQAQERIHADAPWVPLAHMQQVVVLNKKVQNYKLNPTTKHLFHKVWLEK